MNILFLDYSSHLLCPMIELSNIMGKSRISVGVGKNLRGRGSGPFVPTGGDPGGFLETCALLCFRNEMWHKTDSIYSTV